MTPRKAEVYQSDRGDKYDIATMETSHLVNVLGHHLAQIKTLESLYGRHPHFLKLRARTDMLQKVVQVLTHELVKRDVSLKEYLPNGD
jgi:hypothetical protein